MRFITVSLLVMLALCGCKAADGSQGRGVIYGPVPKNPGVVVGKQNLLSQSKIKIKFRDGRSIWYIVSATTWARCAIGELWPSCTPSHTYR